jgi:AcrR family transcriptional regulator
MTQKTKGERTRETILAAAEQLIISQGYHGTSMRQIADEAGIAVGGIYNHFAGKEAIFAALVEEHQPYTDIAAGLSGLPGESAAELVENAARLAIDELLSDPVFVRLAMIDMQEFEGHTLVQFAKQLIQGLFALGGQLVASGQVRQDVSLPVLMRSFAGVVVFYAISELAAFRADPPLVPLPSSDEIDWIGGLVDVYLHGVLRKE